MFGLVERDFHITKYFSSEVMISGGKVIDVSEPTMAFCPLASRLYKGFAGAESHDKDAIKRAIKEAIESKIKDFGLFTEERKLVCDEVAIPYGASEMMMFALKKHAIDAAVVVCEGAGTVITDRPDVVQGIGARLNSLVVTTPIRGIMKQLKQLGGHIASRKGVIDQVSGVATAIKLGYKKIAVTVSGSSADKLEDINQLRKVSGVEVLSLVVCTSGVKDKEIALIGKYADLVWSCASSGVREKLGPSAKIQLAKSIPVFVLTNKGVDFVSALPSEILLSARRKLCHG